MATRTATSKVAQKRRAPAKSMKSKPPARGTAKTKAHADTEAVKPTKVKLVRDSFTIPKAEYAGLDDLKKRAARAGIPSKKSELLRAGLLALASMSEASFRTAVQAVPRLKTGRPKKG